MEDRILDSDCLDSIPDPSAQLPCDICLLDFSVSPSPHLQPGDNNTTSSVSIATLKGDQICSV